jgi:hypothetical protein
MCVDPLCFPSKASISFRSSHQRSPAKPCTLQQEDWRSGLCMPQGPVLVHQALVAQAQEVLVHQALVALVQEVLVHQVLAHQAQEVLVHQALVALVQELGCQAQELGHPARALCR